MTRIAIYDTSKAAGAVRHTWPIGALALKARGKLDAARGFDSLGVALRWCVEVGSPAQEDVVKAAAAAFRRKDSRYDAPHGRITQLELWCHGFTGGISWGGQAYREIPMADQLRRALAPDAVVWFRSCRTFHGRDGLAFAVNAHVALGCDVAGHTFDIGPWQSGLHRVNLQIKPWDIGEGGAVPSHPWRPNTIHCLQNDIPEGF